MRKLLVLLILISLPLFAKNTISQKAYAKLQKSQKLLEVKKTKEAKEILTALLSTSKNSMERTYAYQGLASIEMDKSNYKNVIKYYEKIVLLNALEKKDLNSINFSLAQLYLNEEQYKKSIKKANMLLEDKSFDKSRVYETLALGYYYNKEYKNSLLYIQNTIKLKKKKESWYRMLYSAYVEIKDFKNAIKTLKVMTKRYPNVEAYWLQLVSLYQNTKQIKKALSNLELAYKNGVVKKEKNALYFASLLLHNSLYSKASLLLEDSLKKGILKNDKKTFDLLISSLINAKMQKKAITYLQNSKFAKNDKYQLILADIYFSNLEYTKAINTLKKHSFKKASKKNGQKNILLALSYYEIDKSKKSVQYLKKAALNKYEKKRAFNIAKSLGLTL